MRLLGPAIALALLAATLARADNEKLAEHLRKLDPGALVGGKSIVGTEPKEELHGVHGKPNFIIALGDEETIHGASADDQVGAIGKGVKLVPSNHGHSLIVAGPDSEVVVTGKGHNLIYSHAKGATIILESPGDEVIANGPHDRIVCAKHSSQELIEVANGEQVSKSCKGHHNETEPLASSSLSARSSAARAHASAGDCVFADVDCTESFELRTLNGLWAGEQVPKYSCPGNHPFLLNHSYAPFGARVTPGVEPVVVGGLIGFDIPGAGYTQFYTPGLFRAVEIAGQASATSWAFGSSSYRVILHCSSDPAHGYGP
jgi:hypothetical protein